MQKIKPYLQKKDDRGLIFGITNNYNWQEINFIQSKKGTLRGGHYHKKTKEGFYIISGEIKIKIKNIKSKETISFNAKVGDIFVIEPYELHTFKMLENSSWINMLNNRMDQNQPDIYTK